MTWIVSIQWRIQISRTSVVVQLLSHVQLFESWTAAQPGFPVLHHLPEFAQTHVHWIGDAIHPSLPLVSCLLSPLLSPCPLLLLPSVLPRIRIFSNKLALHIRWPKYWNFGFSISPSNEHSGVISSRINWFDLLAAQELFTLIDPYYFSSLSLTKIKIMISQKWTSRVSLMKGNPWGQWTVLWC